MLTTIESKHGTVARQPAELFMAFSDMRNFIQFLPEDKKAGVTAEYDTLQVSIQGFSIGVKVHERVPYSRIEFVDYGAPVAFHVVLFFDPSAADPFKTDFHILVEAELNLMMKMMLSGKIKDALDKVVDGLEDPSKFQMPDVGSPS